MNKYLSRKLLVAIGAGIVSFVGSIWPGQEELAEKIVLLAIAYIVSQGLVDSVTEYKGEKDEHT